MAYENTFYKLVDKMLNTFTLQGFTQVSYGTEKDLDLNKRQSNYPLAHIILPSGTISSMTQDFNFVIVIADKLDKTGNNNKQYGNDNTIDIQQSLLNKLQYFINDIQEKYKNTYDSIEIGYTIGDVTYNSFKEDYPELLAGFIINVTISLPTINDYC